MINLLVAIDLEVKYHKLRAVDHSVDNLALLHPRDMRRLFVMMYKLFPSKLLIEYEAQQSLEVLRAYHVVHTMVA